MHGEIHTQAAVLNRCQVILKEICAGLVERFFRGQRGVRCLRLGGCLAGFVFGFFQQLGRLFVLETIAQVGDSSFGAGLSFAAYAGAARPPGWHRHS